MGERENPISIRSKRRITDALLELMQDTPFAKISIKDIVDKAGLTRQTFYHNYETKEDVLLGRLDEYFNEFFVYLSKRKVTDWEDIICCFFRYWQEHADFMRLLMKNDMVHLLSGQLPNYYSVLQDVHFSKTDLTEAEAKLWFSFATGALISTLTTWLSSPGGISARALAKTVCAMLDGTAMKRNLAAGELDPTLFLEALSARN